ncbi:MAG: hypothetical protein V9F03_04135 [Microthrixaceae bacterium]
MISTTVRQALGDIASAGTGKFAAALLTSMAGSPELRCCVVEHVGDRLRVTNIALQSHHLCSNGSDLFSPGVKVFRISAGDRDLGTKAGEL